MHLAVILFLLQDLLKQLSSKSLNSSYTKILQKLDFDIRLSYYKQRTLFSSSIKDRVRDDPK